jgi:hypothetical protein
MTVMQFSLTAELLTAARWPWMASGSVLLSTSAAVFDSYADMIVAIDNVHVDGKNMDQVAALIRGDVGSSVVIDVLRRGQVLAWL